MPKEEFDKFLEDLTKKCKELPLDQLTEVEMVVWVLVRERLGEHGFFEH